MRHNASVRQMTMRATSSPNKLQPRAPALRRPWGVIVPVAPLTGAWVGVCATAAVGEEKHGDRMQDGRENSKRRKKNRETKKKQVVSPQLLASSSSCARSVESWAWTGIACASRGRAALDLDVGVAVLHQSQYCMSTVQ